jgi:hypothetical protein
VKINYQKLALCVSTGYIVYETDQAITLVSDFASTDREEIDSIGNTIVIPKSCIVKEVDHSRQN